MNPSNFDPQWNEHMEMDILDMRADEWEEQQKTLRELAEEEKAPSFFALHGRKPISGVDFDPDGCMSQDDYEFFTGTGGYTDNPR